MDLRKFCFKLLAVTMILSTSLTTGCHKKEVLPQPEFPLSEKTLMELVQAQGLDWTLGQSGQAELADSKSAYGLIRPETEKDFSTVMVTSARSDKIGRYLSAVLVISRDELQWPLEEPHSWSDWKELLQLSARLYGGFEDDEAIYRACSETELSVEETLLWDGALTGGYCRISTSAPIQDWSPYVGGKLVFYIYVDIFESTDAYHIFSQEYV